MMMMMKLMLFGPLVRTQIFTSNMSTFLVEKKSSHFPVPCLAGLQRQRSNPDMTFHTGCLRRILIMAYYNPHTTG